MLEARNLTRFVMNGKRAKNIKMNFMSSSLAVLVVVLGCSRAKASQDAAKLTVNFGKLIRHSLGAGPEKKVKLENAQHPHTALVPNA